MPPSLKQQTLQKQQKHTPTNIMDIQVVPMKNRRKPFITPTGTKALSEKPDPLNPLNSRKAAAATAAESMHMQQPHLLELFEDAETGDSMSFTSSSWNPKEGRVDTDARSLRLMGTGRLDIAYRKKEAQAAVMHIENIPTSSSSCHPLAQVNR